MQRAFFIFIFFENIFYRNIFSISHFTVLYPYRPAGGRQGACRPVAGQQGLICKFKKKLFAREPLAGACRPPGGRQAPHSCIKGFPSPLPPHLLPTTSREREGERRGEGGSCNGEALPDFGSEPQVINISQLSRSKFFMLII